MKGEFCKFCCLKFQKCFPLLDFRLKIVYNQIVKQKFFPEDIHNTGLSSGELLSALTELEMEFLIKALPGGMYEKI